MSYYERIDFTRTDSELQARLNDLETYVREYEMSGRRKEHYYMCLLEMIREIEDELVDRQLADELFSLLPDADRVETSVTFCSTVRDGGIVGEQQYIIAYLNGNENQLYYSEPIQAKGKSTALCKFNDAICAKISEPWELVKRDFYCKRVGVIVQHKETKQKLRFLPFAFCAGKKQRENQISWEQWERY